MSNDKMRAEFEAAYESGQIYQLERESQLRFYDIYKQRAWAAWQASRATLVLELPFEFVNGMMRADQVIAAIEAEGVRVKP